MADPSGKPTRWRIRLLELQFDIVHYALTKHLDADVLLRLPTDGSQGSKLNDEIKVMRFNPRVFGPAHSIKTEQKEAEAIAYSIP